MNGLSIGDGGGGGAVGSIVLTELRAVSRCLKRLCEGDIILCHLASPRLASARPVFLSRNEETSAAVPSAEVAHDRLRT